MRRPRRAALALAPILLVLAVAWLGWTSMQAYSSLRHARGLIPQVQSALLTGRGSTVQPELQQVRDDAATGYRRTHDPIWWAASHLPVVGEPLATVRGLTEAVRAVGDTALPALAEVTEGVQLEALHPRPDTVDVAALARAARPLQTASTTLDAQDDALARLAPSWLAPVAKAREQLRTQLAPVAATVSKASLAAQLLPPMLGNDGPRDYFVGFQNPAEARGTGGLLGAYAIVHADKGTVSVEELGSNADLPALPGSVPGLDQAFLDRYGSQGAAALWVNANVSPDFPEVSRTWLAMWRAGTGRQLDGSLALDPDALAALVRATGPVKAPGIGTVSAAEVPDLVLKRQYEISGDVATRKDAMVGVGQAVLEALLRGRVQPQSLVSSFGPLSRQRHVVVASSHPQEEALLRRGGLAGQVDSTPGPFAQAVVVNAAGGKLDAYLGTSLNYDVTSCTASTRTVVLTATLVSTAPTSGLPAYVVTRADRPSYATVPGQNRTDLRLLTTRGARLTSATLDGKPLLAPAVGELPDVIPAGSADAFLSQTQQAGRPSFGLTLELPPGATRTLSVTLQEPASRLPPVLPTQPLARPTRVTSDLSACSAP